MTDALDMTAALEKMRKEGITVESFWTSDPDENPDGWDAAACRYVASNGPLMKDLTDGAFKGAFDRLERKDLVVLWTGDGGDRWTLTDAGRNLATVSEVMES